MEVSARHVTEAAEPRLQSHPRGHYGLCDLLKINWAVHPHRKCDPSPLSQAPPKSTTDNYFTSNIGFAPIGTSLLEMATVSPASVR
jgi:hypothetical protein